MGCFVWLCREAEAQVSEHHDSREVQPSSFTFRKKVGFEAKVYFFEAGEIRPRVERILEEWEFIEGRLERIEL